MSRLYSFKGGLALTQQPDRALDHPILEMPLPAQLVLPLATRDTTPRRAIVNVGDHVTCGQILAVDDSDAQVPLLASADAVVERIISDTITLSTTSHNTAEDSHRSTPAATETVSTTDVQPVTALQHLGVQGLGGAAFSSFAKLRNGTDSSIHTLIINAAECEPMICCDQALIREHANEVLDGIKQLMSLCAADQCLIGIEDSMSSEIALLNRALDTAQATNIKLVPIPTRYPTGGEKQLIQVLTGLTIPATQLPRDQGVICFNIATAFAIKRALLNKQPQTDRIVTITGTAVDTPRNVRVKFGTRLIDLLNWMNIAPASAMRVTVGGPLSGQAIDVDAASVTASTNCLIIDHQVAQQPASACIRCGECDKVCPASLLPQQLHWYCRDQNLADAEKFHLSSCIECGCCDYVCPSNIDLTAQFRMSKRQAAEHQRTTTLANLAQQRFAARELRLKRKEQLRQQKIQQRKEALDKKRAQRNAGTGR